MPEIQEKNRNPDGTFKDGFSGNPNGRPKKGLALTDIMRDVMEESLVSGVTRKEAFVRKVLDMAYNGNEQMIKLAWSYLDGNPTNRTELSGLGGDSIEVTIREVNNE